MINWVKNKLARLAIATSSMEKNLSSNADDFLSSQNAVYADIHDGHMIQGLIKGEVTQEVEMIRAQMYKIMEAADDLQLTISGYETGPDPETGEIVSVPVFKPVKKNHVFALKRVKTDEFDHEHALRYVINNEDFGLDSVDGIKDHDMKSNFKFELTYSELPRFELDERITKINIREIDEEFSILEMYYNQYDDGYNVLSKAFASTLNNMYDSGNKLDVLLGFNEIGFSTTKKDMGVKELRAFMYKDPEFIRQTKFNGCIVCKFKVKNVMVDFPMTDKYINEKLEELYENKSERKKMGF